MKKIHLFVLLLFCTSITYARIPLVLVSAHDENHSISINLQTPYPHTTEKSAETDFTIDINRAVLEGRKNTSFSQNPFYNCTESINLSFFLNTQFIPFVRLLYHHGVNALISNRGPPQSI